MSSEHYADDLAFLRRHTDIIELTGPGEARLAVAPAYEGRVMTSTIGGKETPSFGWLNRAFIASGQESPLFNNFGGEDRFWLGPEGGQFALYFTPGDPLDLEHWATPAGFDRGGFAVTSREDASLAMAKEFEVTNYAGTTFPCAVTRVISALDADQATKALGVPLPSDLDMVAFESSNRLANQGEAPWGRDGGLVSIWTLGQFKPLPNGTVIVPFRAGGEADLGPRATTNYFGDLPSERGRLTDSHLLFKCDGQFRSKIGISPARAKSVLGSYDPDGGVLTLVRFTLPEDAAELPYVNSLWETQEHPFAGDVVNSYNDGQAEDGSRLGPFYELETSSPAAELAPGEAQRHVHQTFHFAGDADALDDIARKVLGISLQSL